MCDTGSRKVCCKGNKKVIYAHREGYKYICVCTGSCMVFVSSAALCRAQHALPWRTWEPGGHMGLQDTAVYGAHTQQMYGKSTFSLPWNKYFEVYFKLPSSLPKGLQLRPLNVLQVSPLLSLRLDLGPR